MRLPSRPPFCDAQPLEERVRAGAVHLDLGEQREGHAEAALAERARSRPRSPGSWSPNVVVLVLVLLLQLPVVRRRRRVHVPDDVDRAVTVIVCLPYRLTLTLNGEVHGSAFFLSTLHGERRRARWR